MIWQPYRQQGNTHLEKLAAFLNIYSAALETEAATALQGCHASWSSDAFPEQVWRDYLQHLSALNQHAAAFAENLTAESDLASKLVIFCRNT
jgi:hypothetical protein